MRDSRFRAMVAITLILVLAILGYKFAGGGIGSKQTNLPGPRYFNGHVSESEIYAGAINTILRDRDYATVYLRDTTKRSKDAGTSKRLPAAVERLARKPFRPIYANNRRVAPIKAPIRRVANDAGLIGQDKKVINAGVYIEVGPIEKGWFKPVRISVHDSGGWNDHRVTDYEVNMSKGRLVFRQTSVLMT